MKGFGTNFCAEIQISSSFWRASEVSALDGMKKLHEQCFGSVNTFSKVLSPVLAYNFVISIQNAGEPRGRSLRSRLESDVCE